MLLNEEKITCPNCGTTDSVTIYSSVNVTQHPELKEAVLTGELFIFTCPNCGAQTRLDYDVLYHDMEKQIMIQKTQENGISMHQLNVSTMFSLTNGRVGNYTVRYVTSYSELVEKILLFDAGLDDRVYYLMVAQYANKLLSENVDFDDLVLLPENNELIVYIIKDGRPIGHIPVDLEFYDEMSNVVDFDNSGNNQYVNLPWAMEHFIRPQ